MRDNEQILNTIAKADKTLRECISQLLQADASATAIRGLTDCLQIVEEAARSLNDDAQQLTVFRGFPPIQLYQQNYCVTPPDSAEDLLIADEFEGN